MRFCQHQIHFSCRQFSLTAASTSGARRRGRTALPQTFAVKLFELTARPGLARDFSAGADNDRKDHLT
jgi:hypothetical protein